MPEYEDLNSMCLSVTCCFRPLANAIRRFVRARRPDDVLLREAGRKRLGMERRETQIGSLMTRCLELQDA